MKERLVAFRRRHGVAAVGAATLDATLDSALDTVGGVTVEGVTRRGSTDTVAESDQWHIGSCAKALTAALYARLVEQGRAEWGAHLVDLLPDLARSAHPQWAAVTIDDLLLCRSGLPANPTRAAMLAAYDDQAPAVEQRSRAVRHALAGPPDGHGQFRYSNLGYVVAGAAIDQVTGSTFERALAAEVLEPLGVTSAGFGPPPRLWGHRPRVRLGSLCLGQGGGVEPGDSRSDNPSLLTPAGRLHLSLPDWARVQRLFLDGAGLLSPVSLQHLLHLPTDGRGMAMGWAAAKGMPGVELGMQGSNTAWSATALISPGRRRMALVTTNDGRTSMLRATALLAAELLHLSDT